MAVKATEPNATYVGSCRTVPTRAWQKEAKRNVPDPFRRTVAPDFKLRLTRPVAFPWRSEGKAGHPRFLSCGLESGLRRPDGALQRNPSRVPQTWRRAL